MTGVTLEDIMNLLEMLKDSGIDEVSLRTSSLRFRVSKGGLRDSASETSEPAEGLIPIKASMLGFFQGASPPGGAPFPALNQYVNEGDALCAMHVLDQRHILKADLSGWIRRIIPSEGELVEYQQTLFLVEPADGVQGGGA